MISTVLLDLDGVIGHFDPDDVTDVERRHQLAPGTLMAAAFEPKLLERVITGQIPRTEWGAEVGRRVGSAAAASEWLAQPGTIDETMLDEVRSLRASGLVVAVLTNGTDTIPQEMERFGIAGCFDAIFNSAEIGYAKPDRRAFAFVCNALEVDPSAVLFTDDSPSKLAGARALGMTAHVFEGIESFRAQLKDAGCR